MSLGLVIALLALLAVVFVITVYFSKPAVNVLRVLIRVDMQNDFCPGGSLPVAEGNLIVGIINKLSQLGKRLGYYDLVVDTQDSHPANHGSFFTQHPGLAAFTETVLNGIKQMLWTVHCVVGTKGWEFHPELDRSMVDKTVPKGQDERVDSYSGFFDNGRSADAETLAQFPFLGKSTGLAEYLFAEAEKRNADEIEIHVCGLAFRFCVSFTAKDGRSLVYRGKQLRVRVVEDATKAIVFAEGDYEREVAELKALGIEFVTGQELINEAYAFSTPMIAYPPYPHY